MLSATHLGCQRDGRTLFSGLGVQLLPGQLTELRGPNGSGKSTLLRILAGLFPEYEGTVEAGASVLYVGHRPGLSGPLSVSENLLWLQSLGGASQDDQAVVSALERVGLRGYERVPVAHLSAGQARRAALARLVLSDHSIWLLDEPLTALDRAGERLLADLLDGHRLRSGCALIATHQDLPLVVDQRVDLRR